MQFSGPIVRPATDANSVFIEVTVGCTHDACTFCNFYKGFPFRVIDIEKIERDLQEAVELYPHAKRAWASGGNPLALSMDRLIPIGKLFRKYLPEANIATYGRINDFYNKSVDDLKQLKELGFNDIVIGIESGDDEVLKAVNKGYTAADIVRECQKIEASGMQYRVIYLGGLAGHDKAVESAKRSAAVWNQIKPHYMYLTTVSLLPDTELFEEMKRGEFEEVTELERVQEFREFIVNLNNEITVDANTSTNGVTFRATLPQEKKKLIQELNKFIGNYNEDYERGMRMRRSMMRTV
ncbi:MAG: radical SAM protein [Veillonella sp.]|uniref:radical SAM protein n=1 Tax=Veillonella sp. TaxID=1926307 RepID=UPI0025E4AFAE|nr:radical SAM protein [Veillonella sp.]MBS4913342.1 radical SAM protein [Veillonella sp.]